MKLEKRKLSGREKDEESIRLLAQLREKLYSDNASVARRTAFSLSWMQEDGLEILEEALFSRAARHTKSAAAYGMRSTHGRMKKKARQVLERGLEHNGPGTEKVCKKALATMDGSALKKPATAGRNRKFEIRELRNRSNRRLGIPKKRSPFQNSNP